MPGNEKRSMSEDLKAPECGWTAAEAADTRSRLAIFEEDWNAPGMDEYDRL